VVCRKPCSRSGGRGHSSGLAKCGHGCQPLHGTDRWCKSGARLWGTHFTRTVVGAYVMSPTLPVSHILRTVFSLMPPVRPIPWMLGWYGWASDFSDTSDSSRAPVHNEPASTKNSSRKHEKCVRLMLGLSVEAQCLLDSFPNETGTLSPLLQMPLYCPRSFSGTATYR